MSLETLVKTFTSPVAIFLVMALAILWLVREYHRLTGENKDLYNRIIRYLELRSAATKRMIADKLLARRIRILEKRLVLIWFNIEIEILEVRSNGS